MYRTLKCQTRSNQSRDLKIDIDQLNNFFTSIGPELSRQVPKPRHTIDIPYFDKTMVLNDTSPDEIAQVISKMKKTKRVRDLILLATRYSNAVHRLLNSISLKHLMNASKMENFQIVSKLQRLSLYTKKVITVIPKTTVRLGY